MGHTASKTEKRRLRIFSAVSLAMTVSSFATSMSLADDPRSGEAASYQPRNGRDAIYTTERAGSPHGGQ